MKKLSTEEFIEKASRKYPNLDFSKVNYVNSATKITIVCPQHGEIFATPNHLLMSKSEYFCQKCEIENGNIHALRYGSTENFLMRFQELYPEQYKYFDFSKTAYVGIRKPITITCPVHGDIVTTPFAMLLSKKEKGSDGKMCSICNQQNQLSEYFTSLKEKVYAQFPNIEFTTTHLTYDPDSLIIGNGSLDVEIFCTKHNKKIQMQLASLHKCLYDRRNPCRNCNGKVQYRNYSNDEFIQYLKEIYSDKNYDYSMTEYVNWSTKVKIICPHHGVFLRLPSRLEEGRGCPYCKESLLEREIRLFLKNQNVDFVYQYRNKDILGLKTLDFFLPEYNAAIECQGKQHLNSNSIFNEKVGLTIQDVYSYDQKKQQACLAAGIKIFYYTNIIPDITYFDKLWYNKEDLLKAIRNG